MEEGAANKKRPIQFLWLRIKLTSQDSSAEDKNLLLYSCYFHCYFCMLIVSNSNKYSDYKYSLQTRWDLFHFLTEHQDLYFH